MDLQGLFSAVGGVSTLLSVVVAVYALGAAKRVPFDVEKERQRAVARELKIDCLRKAAGLRSTIPTQQWLSAFNEAPVVFNDSERVLAALVAFQRGLSGPSVDSLLLDVIKAMMDDLGLKRSHLDDDFLMRPFNAPVA